MAFVSSSIHFCRGSIARHGAGSKRPLFVSLRNLAAKPRDLLASRWFALDVHPTHQIGGLSQHNTMYITTGWWFGTFFLFFHTLGIMIPTDFRMFQRGSNHELDNVYGGFLKWGCPKMVDCVDL